MNMKHLVPKSAWKWKLSKRSPCEWKQQPNSISTKYEKTSYLKNVFIYRQCRWHRWLNFTFEYLREFLKNLKWFLRYTQGLGENWFMKKSSWFPDLLTLFFFMRKGTACLAETRTGTCFWHTWTMHHQLVSSFFGHFKNDNFWQRPAWSLSSIYSPNCL